MRDHRRLMAFKLADELVFDAYRATRTFPKDELFGLTSQIRRAVISVPANIVEACAQQSHRAYVHQLETAHGSARELSYLIDVARRLGYFREGTAETLTEKCDYTCRTLAKLILTLRKAGEVVR